MLMALRLISLTQFSENIEYSIFLIASISFIISIPYDKVA